MGIKRLKYNDLNNWKNSKRRKPLILRGARQVGKTTLVKKFAQSYSHSILLNLEKDQNRDVFEQNDAVHTIRDQLFFMNNISTDQEAETLLFIDEIQESPAAIHLLRYFYEELPNLHVIAAGSLLEFALKDVKSFPVGRVTFLHLYPLNFQEFLEALGWEEPAKALQKVPIDAYAHEHLKNLFHQYAIVGGMPEIVDIFKEKQSIADLPETYENIWSTYRDDIEKYTNNATERKVVRHIMQSAHLFLDERIKFQNFGNSGYRSREVSEAFRDLDAAQIIQLIKPTTEIKPPIKPDLRKAPRMHFLDTGLVNHALKIQQDMLALDDLSYTFKGALIPHLITQEFISLNQYNHSKPNFWISATKHASSEVDLVTQAGKWLIPVEVKSGKAGKLRSLHQFVERCEHHYAVRMYAGKFSVEQHITPMKRKKYTLMNVPYYLGTQIPAYINWFLENY